MSEAGKLGWAASKEIHEKAKAERIQKYNENSRSCGICGGKIPYEKRMNNFCSQTCAAIYRNAKKEKPTHPCKFCGKKIQNYKKNDFCSQRCFHENIWESMKIFFEENGFWENCNSERTSRTNYKRYLLEKRGHKCEICGLEEWMGQPMPLILDHVDGNAENCELNNLRLVCGNCDMQLSTYKGRNKGNGREWRRKANESKKELVKETIKIQKKCPSCGSDFFTKNTKAGMNKKYCSKECRSYDDRKIERPTKEELEKMVLEKSFKQIGIEFGVVENTIRNWYRDYGFDPKKYNMQKII
jgi:endogenous inhibitor of DNA gyrase (YacG/DUF329 family)